MTGAMPLWGDVTDGELARAAAEGDRQAFAEIYDRYADRLYDFCVGMVGDRDGAADCVQDAFCAAATELKRLREPDKLRPWLYSIVRHHAMRRLRRRYREESLDEMPDMASNEVAPDMMAGQSELARLVAEAAGGLSDRDRELLELHYRHELDGPELAEALGISLTSANTKVFRLRQTIERSLGALLVARHARRNTDACPELVTILKGWDGHLTVLMRKRIARHIESCRACQQEQRRQVNPVALLGGAPVFIPAPHWLREPTLERVQLTAAGSNMPSTAVDSSKPQRIWPRAAMLTGVPLLGLAMTIVWFAPLETSIAPAIQVETEPSREAPSVTTESAAEPVTDTAVPVRPVQPTSSPAARAPLPSPRAPTYSEPSAPPPLPAESTPDSPPGGNTPDPVPGEPIPDLFPPIPNPDTPPEQGIQDSGDPITEGVPDYTGGGSGDPDSPPVQEGTPPWGYSDPLPDGGTSGQDPKNPGPLPGGGSSDGEVWWPIPHIGP
ncbi:MAG: sigma-70 family RNA polymerase sigma factor [Mycolicibacterium sp.]|uniref:RNA polymerase sigma factor n=1 Tax=Mycolicibacterium sp. TaxID=2320850 RepID=UPI003D0AA0AD